MRRKLSWALVTGIVAVTAAVLVVPRAGHAQAAQVDTLTWDYDVVDQVSGPVTLFLVCLDGQPTSACARVPESSGTLLAPGTRTYSWRLPALTPGAHTAQVQACTADAADCSPGVSLAFTLKVVLRDPRNLRMTKAGGA